MVGGKTKRITQETISKDNWMYIQEPKKRSPKTIECIFQTQEKTVSKNNWNVHVNDGIFARNFKVKILVLDGKF